MRPLIYAFVIMLVGNETSFSSALDTDRLVKYGPASNTKMNCALEKAISNREHEQIFNAATIMVSYGYKWSSWPSDHFSQIRLYYTFLFSSYSEYDERISKSIIYTIENDDLLVEMIGKDQMLECRKKPTLQCISSIFSESYLPNAEQLKKELVCEKEEN